MALQALCDLRELAACDLEPVLREETAEWARELDWDLSTSAGLVRKLVDARQLAGVALVDGGEVAGYGYFGLAQGKAQIWDAYVRPQWRNEYSDAFVFRFLLDALLKTPGVQRIESQLLLASAIQDPRLRSLERIFMKLDACPSQPPREDFDIGRCHFELWDDRHLDAAATALWLAHLKHIDAEMNNQYRSFAGAARYVADLVRFPGCAFSRAASIVAFDNCTRQVSGIVLTNFVAAHVGHIAEIAVMPQSRGLGLGHELLRRSVAALRGAGANRVSLTVTACNEAALHLYTQFGFQESRRFYAYAWDRVGQG